VGEFHDTTVELSHDEDGEARQVRMTQTAAALGSIARLQ
jgi:hypothetical protein